MTSNQISGRELRNSIGDCERDIQNASDKGVQFLEIANKMHNIYERKNADYGDAFDKSIDEFGLISPAIRLNDKLNRFKTLITQSRCVDDESIQDTLMDMASYAIMTVMYLNNKK